MLLVDGQAGSKDLLQHFPPELAKKHTLEAGDVAFFGTGPEGPLTFPIGIEYKTAKEALQCMLDGRLAGEQLPKMSRLYKRVYLLIEGEYREGYDDGYVKFPAWKDGKKTYISYSKVPYRSFDNWMNSLVETARIVIKRSVDQSESAAQILNLYYLWSKDYDGHSSAFMFNSSQEPALLLKPSRKRLIASKLPHIGWKRSEAVDKHFPSIKRMINAGADDWCAVKGVGTTVAKAVVAAIEEEDTNLAP
jgi:ERCC4-type nuclease